MIKEIENIVDDLCKENGDFPTTLIRLNGYEYKVFDWGPKTLYEYFNLYEDHVDKDMIVFEKERWTFGDGYKVSAAFANALINEFNIKKGDRVAIASRNFPEWIFSFIAITSIGAIAVPINSWWTTNELEYGLKNCDAKLVIVDDERLERIEPFSKKLDLKTIIIRPNKSDNNNWNNIIKKYLGNEMPIKKFLQMMMQQYFILLALQATQKEFALQTGLLFLPYYNGWWSQRQEI